MNIETLLQNTQDFIVRYWASLLTFTLVCSTVGGFIVFGLNIETFIDSRVEKALSNERVISDLSKRIRPYLIFDEQGHYILNVGCEGLIDIEVTPRTQDKHATIKIVSSKTLPMAPILSALPPYTINVSVTPSRKNDWVYDINMVEVNGPSENPIRYKLEIIQ